jgi:hypothetical protein
MTAEERKRLHTLCEMIEKERNHGKFLELIEELNELLSRKEHRLEHSEKNES